MDVLRSQYEMITRTRESLFRFCESMSPADYVKEVEASGGTSICSLNIHVADCYRVWLGNRGLGKSLPKVKPESIKGVLETRELFKKTDVLVDEFHHRGQILKLGRQLGYIPPKMNL
ncbi:DinB family protein [Paenibacillus sp. CAU 1782]